MEQTQIHTEPQDEVTEPTLYDGQKQFLYAALSRVRSPEGLTIISPRG